MIHAIDTLLHSLDDRQLGIVLAFVRALLRI